MRPSVTYTHYATSSKEQKVNIITFTHFEERNLLHKSCEYAEMIKYAHNTYDERTRKDTFGRYIV